MSISVGSVEIPLQLKKKKKQHILGPNHNFCYLILRSHLENIWFISRRCFSPLFTLLLMLLPSSLRGLWGRFELQASVCLSPSWPHLCPPGKFLWRCYHPGRSFRRTGRKGDKRERSPKTKKVLNKSILLNCEWRGFLIPFFLETSMRYMVFIFGPGTLKTNKQATKQNKFKRACNLD